MSDRYAAQIEIGGRISRSRKMPDDAETSLIEALMGEIASQGVSHEYGDVRLTIVRSTERDLLGFLDPETGYLRFRDDQAVNGEMPEIEEFCRENGIPYRRQSAMYSGCLAESVYFDPGMSQPLTLLCDDAGNEQVEGEEVRSVIQMLLRYSNIGNASSFESRGQLSLAVTRLSQLCPPIPEKMPKFEIIP